MSEAQTLLAALIGLGVPELLICFGSFVVIVGVGGWLLYRAINKPVPKNCPHCGKPLP